jgi:hypothetical protein
MRLANEYANHPSTRLCRRVVIKRPWRPSRGSIPHTLQRQSSKPVTARQQLVLLSKQQDLQSASHSWWHGGNSRRLPPDAAEDTTYVALGCFSASALVGPSVVRARQSCTQRRGFRAGHGVLAQVRTTWQAPPATPLVHAGGTRQVGEAYRKLHDFDFVNRSAAARTVMVMSAAAMRASQLRFQPSGGEARRTW